MVNLITLTDPRSPVAEAFRTLRTNLMFGYAQKPLHTLLVTSPAAGDGKSETLANLAVTFAQAGQRTILVDADLRRPSQHTIWNQANDSGLMQMMTNDTALSTPPLIQTEVDNLSLLTAGGAPDVAADVLSNKRMSEIIGVLKARADYVLFDSPPVLAATDAALLGNKVDGVLLVVRAGKTRRDDTLRARQALERVQVPFLGSVLTNAPGERAGRYGQ